MNSWSDLKTCVIRGRTVLGAITLLAMIVPAASAHTSAVCALTHHNVSCAGTIADRPLARLPAQGRMAVHNGYGSISLVVAPMTSIRTNLVCAQQASGLTCVGIAKAMGRRVLITTAGSPDHGTVVIRVSNAVTPPQKPVTTGRVL